MGVKQKPGAWRGSLEVEPASLPVVELPAVLGVHLWHAGGDHLGRVVGPAGAVLGEGVLLLLARHREACYGL